MSPILRVFYLLICIQSCLWSQKLLIGIKVGTNNVIVPPGLHGWGTSFSGNQIGFEIDYSIKFLHFGTGFTYQSNRLQEAEWLWEPLEIDYLQIDLIAIRVSYSWLSLRTGFVFQKGLFDFNSTFKTALLTFIEPEIRPQSNGGLGALFAYKPLFHFSSDERFIDYYGYYLSFGINYTF